MSEPSPPEPSDDSAGAARPSSRREVCLPAGALSRLSGECGRLGAASVAALREAGRRAGAALVGVGDGDGVSPDLPLDRFWEELRGAAGERGFGAPRYDLLAGDVGEVELRGSPEAGTPGSPEAAAARPGCHFAAGWVGGALTAAAGDRVAVLEVRCAADPGAESCRFLVGPEGRLRRVRADLRGGRSVAEALGSG